MGEESGTGTFVFVGGASVAAGGAPRNSHAPHRSTHARRLRLPRAQSRRRSQGHLRRWWRLPFAVGEADSGGAGSGAHVSAARPASEGGDGMRRGVRKRTCPVFLPDVRADFDLDGDVDSDDETLANSNTATTGWNALSTTANGNRVGYAGYQHDYNLDLNHVRNRVYSAELGRWTRRDPLGYVDGMGLYEYVGSRPMVVVDPIGMSWNRNAQVVPPDIIRREKEDRERAECEEECYPGFSHPVPEWMRTDEGEMCIARCLARRSRPSIIVPNPDPPPPSVPDPGVWKCADWGEKNGDSVDCNGHYPPGFEQCICYCMPDNEIGRCVRGCLWCEYSHGKDFFEAHAKCLGACTVNHPIEAIPMGAQLVLCIGQCTTHWAFGYN